MGVGEGVMVTEWHVRVIVCNEAQVKCRLSWINQVRGETTIGSTLAARKMDRSYAEPNDASDRDYLYALVGTFRVS